MIINSSPIIVLDSGVGGISLVKLLHKTFKNENFIYVADNEFMPYGNKNESALKKRLEKIVDTMIKTYHIKMVVLACNTATMVGLKHLQSKFKIPIYGVNPIQDIPNNAVVICTKLTGKELSKRHFLNFEKAEQNNLQCKYLMLPKLANYIENNFFDKKKINKKVKEIIAKYHLNDYKNIVLGCTHYELIGQYFKENLTNSKVILPSKNTLKNIQKDQILEQIDSKSIGTVYFLSSIPSKSYVDKMYYIFSH